MLIVKKFGGTSVANKERIYKVANRGVEEYKKGNDVVVVLSAMGKYTDELITMAEDINEKPPKREMDMLFTIGEQMSVSLMAMALDKLGVPAVSLNAFQVSMHTTSVHGNARLKRIDTERIRRELEKERDVSELAEQIILKNPDVILVSQEVGYGVVPVDAFDRKYREAVGRVCTQLAAYSHKVTRVACGIGTVIKDAEDLADPSWHDGGKPPSALYWCD